MRTSCRFFSVTQYTALGINGIGSGYPAYDDVQYKQFPTLTSTDGVFNHLDPRYILTADESVQVVARVEPEASLEHQEALVVVTGVGSQCETALEIHPASRTC
jgi:2-keto-3-deoxy-L-rhamnonate aldolase RhmA